jgi:hypothetical protein
VQSRTEKVTRARLEYLCVARWLILPSARLPSVPPQPVPPPHIVFLQSALPYGTQQVLTFQKAVERNVAKFCTTPGQRGTYTHTSSLELHLAIPDIDWSPIFCAKRCKIHEFADMCGVVTETTRLLGHLGHMGTVRFCYPALSGNNGDQHDAIKASMIEEPLMALIAATHTQEKSLSGLPLS